MSVFCESWSFTCITLSNAFACRTRVLPQIDCTNSSRRQSCNRAKSVLQWAYRRSEIVYMNSTVFEQVRLCPRCRSGVGIYECEPESWELEGFLLSSHEHALPPPTFQPTCELTTYHLRAHIGKGDIHLVLRHRQLGQNIRAGAGWIGLESLG